MVSCQALENGSIELSKIKRRQKKKKKRRRRRRRKGQEKKPIGILNASSYFSMYYWSSDSSESVRF